MDGLCVRACVSIVFFPYIIIVMNKYDLTPTTMYFLRDTAKKKKMVLLCFCTRTMVSFSGFVLYIYFYIHFLFFIFRLIAILNM